MLNRIEGKKYLFTDNDGKFPYTLNKKRVDKAIETLKKDISHFNKTIKDLYETDSEIYHLIIDNFYYYDDDFDEGKSYMLNRLENDLEDLQNKLSEDDDIPKYEDVVVLEDLGFENKVFGEDGLWEKVIENSEEKEVVEEIWPYDEVAKYRTRTTLWEIIEPGYKKSKSITYKNKKIGKKLAQAIKNTKEREKKE